MIFVDISFAPAVHLNDHEKFKRRSSTYNTCLVSYSRCPFLFRLVLWHDTRFAQQHRNDLAPEISLTFPLPGTVHYISGRNIHVARHFLTRGFGFEFVRLCKTVALNFLQESFIRRVKKKINELCTSRTAASTHRETFPFIPRAG